MLAANTPPLDDNSKKLMTTEALIQAFTGTGKRLLSQIGYQVFPGGLILQWGNTTVPASSSVGVTMPKAWPNLILCAVGNVGTPITPGPWACGVSPRPSFPNEILIQNTDTIQHGVLWLAIGY